MKMTFRWFGSKSDSVTLKDIRQIPGVGGIMGVLDDKSAGEVWEYDEIKSFVNEVNESSLECEVIESVNVHEDIKLGLPTREKYIDNYKETIKNLSKCGIKVIVYNFMPVLDWLRTDLNRLIEDDGSYSLYFNEKDLGEMTPPDIVKKTGDDAGSFSLPGWEPNRLCELAKTLELYEKITPDILLENYKYFLNRIMPVCEEYGVVMACHPDDPAWPIFGLPRIAYNEECFEKIIALNNSPCHTLCLCTGSLGSNPDNDIVSIIRNFGKRGRVGCIHIRNIKHLGYRTFRESAHLSTDGDLDMYAIVKAVYETCPNIYIRPDHGRSIWNEKSRPGYGLYDRALGAVYLNGLWEGIDKARNE